MGAFPKYDMTSKHLKTQAETSYPTQSLNEDGESPREGYDAVNIIQEFAQRMEYRLSEMTSKLTQKIDFSSIENNITHKAKRQQAMSKFTRYFVTHQQRMRYAAFKAHGLPYGSGYVKRALRRVWVLDMLTAFGQHHPQVKVNALVCDTQYGSCTFMEQAAQLMGHQQVISQLRRNQKVRFRGCTLKLNEYFARYPGTPFVTTLRGGQALTVIVSSARLYVTAHGCKRFVIALKYEDEEEYRYLIAKELSWRTLDIINAYQLRGLIEVFFEDWKRYEGWGQLIGQTTRRRRVLPQPDFEPIVRPCTHPSPRANNPLKKPTTCVYRRASM